MPRVLKIHPDDSVAVALEPLEKGTENPSPGNRAGGLSTLEEKSLGCTQKAGGEIVLFKTGVTL